MQNTLQLTPVGNMVGNLQLHYLHVLCYNKQLFFCVFFSLQVSCISTADA